MKRLLLVGAGHAHAQVLLDWRTAPLPGVELVLASPHTRAPYSGMVPGWLAGAYRYDEICIDFAELARAAGASLLIDEVVAMDAARRTVQLARRGALDYDVLSLNVGSTLTPPAAPGARMLSLRPLARLHASWEALLDGWADDPGTVPKTVTAVGGGAAGVESLLAVLVRLRALAPGRRFRARLVTQSRVLLPGLAPGAVRAAEAALAAAGVAVLVGTAWAQAPAEDDELLLWATGAQAHGWQAHSGLAVGDTGFIRIDEYLRSTSHPEVQAVGDCAHWEPALPKAGVHAVRMGPVLACNLRAALGSGQPVAYVPQQRFLVLLGNGNGRAIASRGRLWCEGGWVWRWKQRIDRRFLQRFAVG